jgi:hypothetical protein
MRLRSTLLLGTAFLAGLAIGPASDLIARHFVRGLGINSPSPRSPTVPIATDCSPCLAMYSSVMAVRRSSIRQRN